VLEWDPIELATADVISLSLFRNGQKAGNIPQPTVIQSTKISGLAVDTEYNFQLVLRTSAGTFSSEKLVVRTHKMTDLSGITITPGILPAQLKESLTKAVERIGAKLADTVRIDTTHFVTTEGRGIAWEKAVEMNIPVVRPEWVEGCERGGRIVGVRQYYLDADPRQRMANTGTAVPGQQPTPNEPRKASPPKEQAPLPAVPTEDDTSAKTTSESEAAEEKGPAKSEKNEEESEEEEEEDEEDEEESEADKDEAEEQKTELVEEQKVRVEDREQQKVALRPADSAADRVDSKSRASATDAEEGRKTPGDASSFQDVAL